MLLLKLFDNGLNDLVRKLVLIAPAAYPQPLPFFIAIPRIPLIGRAMLQFLSAELQLKITLKIVVKKREILTKKRIRRYKDNIADPSCRNALIKTALNILPQRTEHFIDKAEKIPLRTLLIYGENDSVILRRNLKRLSLNLPNILTKKMIDCGHFPHEEYPELVTGMLSEFLYE